MHQGRLRLRPWLEEQIDSGRYPGVMWLDEAARVFQIPWKHAARHGWNIEKDATLFRNWAIHTGRYKPGIDKPDPKTWKANFRCALNSLTDVKELQDKSIKKGHNAFRVYILLPHSKTIKRRKALRCLETDSKAASPPPPTQRNTPLERFTEAFWKFTDDRGGSTTEALRKDDLPKCVEEERPAMYCSQGLQLNKTDEHEQTEAVLKIVDHLKNLDHWSPSYESDRGWRQNSMWMGCLYGVPIDTHYTPDRRRRMEIKIIICALLKKQSHLHLGCAEGETMEFSGYSFQTDCNIHNTSSGQYD